ncbi:MAG: NusG domain II-containing protein [Clostridia bacterium]|nr:NusG domain II-containing protein [Clostridia bacterium]
MKKADFILVLCALAVGLLLLLLPKSSGERLTVLCDGEFFAEYPLSRDCVVELAGNAFEIRDGEVFMCRADCPGGDCLKSRPVSRAGESIVCLPNRLILRIDGKDNDAPDAVTGGVGG